MPITLACPDCGQKYQLKDEFAGRKVKCVKCAHSFEVPTPREVASSTAPSGPNMADLYDLEDEDDVDTAAPALPPAAPSPTRAKPGRGLKAATTPEIVHLIPWVILLGLVALTFLASLFARDLAKSLAGATFLAAILWALFCIGRIYLHAFDEGPYKAFLFIANPFYMLGTLYRRREELGHLARPAFGALGVVLLSLITAAMVVPRGPRAPNARPAGPGAFAAGGAAAAPNDIKSISDTLVQQSNRLTELLKSVRDVPTAQAASAEFGRVMAEQTALMNRLNNDKSLQNAGGFDQVKAASERFNQEVARVDAIPGAREALQSGVDAALAAQPNPGGALGPPDLPPNMPPAPGSADALIARSQQRQAQLQAQNPGQAVRVRAINIPPGMPIPALEAALRDATGSPNVRASGIAQNGVYEGVVAPVTDINSMAANLKLGKARVLAPDQLEVDLAAAAPGAAAPGAIAANHPGANPAAPPPPGADRLTPILAALPAAPPSDRVNIIRQLAGMQVDPDRRADVEAAVQPFLADQENLVARVAAEVLAHWKTPNAVNLLIGMLKDSRFDVRGDVIESLGKLNDPRAAEPLVDLLMSNQDWGKAQRALIAMGPTAEPALIARLKDRDPVMRRTVCQVLMRMGGQATLDAMNKLPADPDPSVRSAAAAAMRAIQQRGGKNS